MRGMWSNFRHIKVDMAALRHNSNAKKSCPLFGYDAAGTGRS
jgi:hypothetical protein